jgi:hypothetical protein
MIQPTHAVTHDSKDMAHKWSTESNSPGMHNPSSTRTIITWEDPHIHRCEVTKTQDPHTPTKNDGAQPKDSLTLLENTYIPFQKMKGEQQIARYTYLLLKKQKENTYSPHDAYFPFLQQGQSYESRLPHNPLRVK